VDDSQWVSVNCEDVVRKGDVEHNYLIIDVKMTADNTVQG